MHRAIPRVRATSLPLARVAPLARPLHSIRPTPASSSISRWAIAQSPFNPLALAIIRRHYSSPTLDKSGKPQENATPQKENPDHQFRTTGAGEEIRNATRDVAEMISGKSHSATMTKAAQQIMGADETSSPYAGHGGVKEDFYSITSTLFQEVPKPALYFGLAGTLPYLGTAVGTVFLSREASLASRGVETITGLDLTTALSTLHTLEAVQITYGAIILSFLGAIHWGMEFAGLGGEQGYRRLVIGVIPVLFAWPTTFLSHGVALAVQWFGFTGTWFLDQRASRDGWTTSWYSTYRFYLSLIVGFSIIGTFAGTNYYGAGAGAIKDTKQQHTKHTTERVSPNERLDRLAKAKAPPANSPDRSGRVEGKVGGDFELVDNEEGDSYTVFRNTKQEDEDEDEDEEGAGEEKEESDDEKEESDDKEEGDDKKEDEDKEDGEDKKEGDDKEESKDEGESKDEAKKKNAEFQDKRDEKQQDKAPGAMKDDAKDRTGKNANMPGGEEEKEDAKGKGGNQNEGGN